mmetsp:Transcript_20490/g.15114  ORF Transcript_20490/g.15114 Transcript_20490/m.15114 type:complete len:152 (+) Transcript_20490:1295-1750(+)
MQAVLLELFDKIVCLGVFKHLNGWWRLLIYGTLVDKADKVFDQKRSKLLNEGLNAPLHFLPHLFLTRLQEEAHRVYRTHCCEEVLFDPVGHLFYIRRGKKTRGVHQLERQTSLFVIYIVNFHRVFQAGWSGNCALVCGEQTVLEVGMRIRP